MADTAQRVIVVKNWHVVLTIAVWLGTFLWSYATLTAQANETARQVKELKDERLTKDQFEEFRQDLFRELDAWEKTQELNRSIRSIH